MQVILSTDCDFTNGSDIKTLNCYQINRWSQRGHGHKELSLLL